MTRVSHGARLLGLFLVCAIAQAAQANCPPKGFDRAALQKLKGSAFEVADDAQRQQLALALLPCLSDPDPILRDGIAFEAYYTWMRARALDLTTRRQLLDTLSSWLQSSRVPTRSDSEGFQKPFAALVLSEVARTDRIEPWLTDAQRGQLVDTATHYVSTITDYRGFEPKEGWRHGVAHGADLLMQLAINPAVDRPSVDRLLKAVATQVAPPGGHSYIEGESGRLARPVLIAAQRGLYTADEWRDWIIKVASPAPLASWDVAFTSREGLAKRHNVHAFLSVLYVNARESSDQNIQALIPGLQAALKTVP